MAAYDSVVMLKTRGPCVSVWVYRKSQWAARFTTGFALSDEQNVEFYGKRWKIEPGLAFHGFL
jgi:hypothetical protein